MTTTSTAAPTPDGASHARENRILTWAWIALCVITIGSWWLAPAHFTERVDPSIPITALVLALTYIKARLVVRYFMEVRTAPLAAAHRRGLADRPARRDLRDLPVLRRSHQPRRCGCDPISSVSLATSRLR